jgi:integration host factor subunit beta
MTMNKADLIADIAIDRNLSQETAQHLVAAVFEHIGAALAVGDRVELRGFGIFEVRHRPARTARNPKNGASVAVPAKAVVHFGAGKALRARVDHA